MSGSVASGGDSFSFLTLLVGLRSTFSPLGFLPRGFDTLDFFEFEVEAKVEALSS